MLKRNIIIVFILFPSIICCGQTQDTVKTKSWTLEAGYQNYRLFDKNMSPLVYVANNGYLGFLLEQEKTTKVWNVDASISIGSNQSKRFGQREAVIDEASSITGEPDSAVYNINPAFSFLEANLAYSYYWKLKPGKTKILIGGQVKDAFLYSGLGGESWYFNQLSIMPICRINIFDNKTSEVAANLSIPFFSYLFRQPFTLDPSLPVNSFFGANLKTGSHISSLNEFQQVNLKLNYRYLIAKEKAIGLSYKFMWMNYANIPDRNLRTYLNTIAVSYTF